MKYAMNRVIFVACQKCFITSIDKSIMFLLRLILSQIKIQNNSCSYFSAVAKSFVLSFCVLCLFLDYRHQLFEITRKIH